VKEKQFVVSLFFQMFSYFRGVFFDHIPKATKHVNIHFFIHSFTETFLMQYKRIPVNLLKNSFV